jgi:hypothetical protein
MLVLGTGDEDGEGDGVGAGVGDGVGVVDGDVVELPPQPAAAIRRTDRRIARTVM